MYARTFTTISFVTITLRCGHQALYLLKIVVSSKGQSASIMVTISFLSSVQWVIFSTKQTFKHVKIFEYTIALLDLPLKKHKACTVKPFIIRFPSTQA